MASQVQNPETAAAINMIVAGVAALREAGTDPVDERDAVVCVTEFEQIRRHAARPLDRSGVCEPACA